MAGMRNDSFAVTDGDKQARAYGDFHKGANVVFSINTNEAEDVQD
jgi:hypothetical protein